MTVFHNVEIDGMMLESAKILVGSEETRITINAEGETSLQQVADIVNGLAMMIDELAGAGVFPRDRNSRWWTVREIECRPDGLKIVVAPRALEM